MKENYIYLQFIVKGFHPYYLNRFNLLFFKKIIKFQKDCLDVKTPLQINIPQKKERFTLLRSPHVDKKARDQFERVTHKRGLIIKIPLKDNISLHLYRFIQSLSVYCVGVNLEVKYKIIKV